MLYSAQLNNEVIEPQVFLCKPNRNTIAKVTNHMGLNRIVNLGKLNEINFSLPYEIEKNNELVRNPLIDLIRERYFIRFEQGNEKEWFIINEISESMDADKDVMSIHAFSLGYELNDRELRYYECPPQNVTQILTDVLAETIWTIGYIDADFNILYRPFNVTDRSILDVIYEVADIFGADVIFDSNKRTVNFKKFDNIGNYLGLTVSLGKLMKSMNKSSFPDEMITILKAFGNEGLTFNDVNPSGTNYIENYDFYMYPFELEDDGVTVLKHSPYMSDELCFALIKYKKLLEENSEEFNNLLTQKEEKHEILAKKQNELAVLTTELEIIKDKLATENAAGNDVSQIIVEKQEKENQVNSKQADIDSVNAEIEQITERIKEFQQLISIENNFTQKELDEKRQYEHVRNWTNDHIVESKDLYEEALKHLEKVKVPKINFEIDIIDFLQVLDEKHNWDKLNIGDTIRIYYEKFNVNVKAKIISIDFDYDSHSIKLQIANFTDLDEDWQKMIRQSYTISSNYNSDKYKWNNASEKLGEINEMINGDFDATKRRIIAGVNESVEISRKGITVQNQDFPNELIVIQAGVVATSNDNLNSISAALTTKGLVAERVYGKMFAGVNLAIENDAGKFTFDSNGVMIKNASFKLISDSGGNGVTITPNEGLVVTKSDNTIKTTLNATEGFKIEHNQFGNWKKKFSIDTYGNLLAEDLTANKLIMKNGNDVLIDGTTRTIDFSNFTTKLGSVYINNIPIMDLIYDFNNNRQGQFDGAIIRTGSIYADQITTGTLRAKVSNIYDCEVGGTLTIGNNGNPTMSLYTSYGSHRIYSSDAAGFRIQSSGTLSLQADSGTIYANSKFWAQNGLQVSGISQFGSRVTVNDTLNASYLTIQDMPVATQSWVLSVMGSYITLSQFNAALAQKETDLKAWANNKFVAK